MVGEGRKPLPLFARLNVIGASIGLRLHLWSVNSTAQDMPSRRRFLAMTMCSVAGHLRAETMHLDLLPSVFAQLEHANGGRLGVAVLDTATGGRSGYRRDERFPMCSTFKFLLAAAILRGVDEGRETLERVIAIPPRPLLFNSPLTEPHAAGEMTIFDLCHAVLTRSDNTAANLLLETIGGPVGVNRFCRSIGDRVTRLDRTETSLNEALAGDPRDTTSPSAMADNLKSVLLGHALSLTSRHQLTLWMEANLTGLDRLRAKIPLGWRGADKTGSNGEHTSNDIAVFWPGDRPPILVAAYITGCVGPESKRAAMLGDIGKYVVESFT
jgi:beta-lactamase class A